MSKRAMLAIKENTKARFDECNEYRQQQDDFVNRLLDLWQATDHVERFIKIKQFQEKENSNVRNTNGSQ